MKLPKADAPPSDRPPVPGQGPDSPAGVRADLRDRITKFPPGHPSSPWDEHGVPRPPVARLSEAEHLEPPLGDADYAAHVAGVNKALDAARAAGLTTDKLYAAGPDLDVWPDDRTELHHEIVDAVYRASAAVPCERRALIAGGLGGAGKTTLLDRHSDIDRSEFLTINPDSFKEELAKRGMVPKVPGLSPMEASTLAHEESSYLAWRLAHRAMADGKNIIWDITMSSVASTTLRIDELKAHGYQNIEGIFVDIPIETSVGRMGERHRGGHDRFLAGQGMGGRYVPADIIRAQADPEYGSVNRRTFETLKGQFYRWTRYDNSISGRAPAIVEQGGLSRPTNVDGTDNHD
jgi:predicted ABC-type ATPase